MSRYKIYIQNPIIFHLFNFREEKDFHTIKKWYYEIKIVSKLGEIL